MTPAHVKEVLKRMWRNNTDVLSLIYAVESKQVPHSSQIHTRYEDLYQMFFIQTVPVAPCKFRNPSKLGDQQFEHPQNTLLTAIINANIDLVSISKVQAEAAPENENQVCQCRCTFWLVHNLPLCLLSFHKSHAFAKSCACTHIIKYNNII